MRIPSIAAATMAVAAAPSPVAADGFLPHAVCYLWDQSLLAVHAVTDVLIGSSYVAISSTLAFLVYRARREIPFHWVFLAFGAFIVACGATHFMEVWTLWQPEYWLAGWVKVVTAVASVATALILPPLVPKALALVRAARLSDAQAEIVRTSEARFRALLESAPDGMIIADRDGRMILVNAQAQVLFGYARDELLGRPVETLLPERVRGAHLGHRERFHADPRTRPMGLGLDLVGRRKDGSEFPAEISLSPLETAEGLLVTTVIRDITERRRADEQRMQLEREQSARADAEAANRMKDQFLATLSHELRTPLNAVYGWARMLRARQLDPDAIERALEVIERNAGVQVQMIDDLLDVSRIITGKMRLEVGLVDPKAVVEAALDVIRPAADAKEIRLTAILDPLAGPITGDADRLQQVVWNLLANAVRFTPKHGRIDVTLRRVNSHVDIVVSDTGEGIDPADLPSIFERFRQGASRQHGGLGIGLALVRHLVDLHGGTVTAHSDGVGAGATFTVRLPMTIAKLEAALTGRAPVLAAVSSGSSRALLGLRVLAVDDDRDSLELVRSILTLHGALVTTAASTKEALECLRAETPDVLLSDIEMPGDDGLALIREVRAASPTGRRFPAVAITAYGRVEDRIRILSAGFNQYLAKPVDPSELVAVIGSVARP
jgi:PAS domain S-box-containing protein